MTQGSLSFSKILIKKKVKTFLWPKIFSSKIVFPSPWVSFMGKRERYRQRNDRTCEDGSQANGGSLHGRERDRSYSLHGVSEWFLHLGRAAQWVFLADSNCGFCLCGKLKRKANCYIALSHNWFYFICILLLVGWVLVFPQKPWWIVLKRYFDFVICSPPFRHSTPPLDSLPCCLRPCRGQLQPTFPNLLSKEWTFNSGHINHLTVCWAPGMLFHFNYSPTWSCLPPPCCISEAVTVLEGGAAPLLPHIVFDAFTLCHIHVAHILVFIQLPFPRYTLVLLLHWTVYSLMCETSCQTLL